MPIFTLKEFQKEHEISLFPIGNAKAPTQGQCHHWIDELEEMEAEKNGGPKVIDGDKDKEKGTTDYEKGEQEIQRDELLDQAHAEAEIIRIARIMKGVMKAANNIVNEEIDTCGADQEALIKEKLGITMFIEAMKRGL